MKKIFTMLVLFFAASALINAQQVNVTFKVDMSVQIAKGAFDAGSDVVSLRGNLNDWGETPMEDGNGDKVYEVTVSFAPDSVVAYKFYHSGGGGTWEDGDNKTLTVPASDLVLDAVLFNGEEMPSGDPADVTFNVDMRTKMRTGEFNPANSDVFIAGSFTDWQNSPVMMTDNDGDSTYTVTSSINSAQLLAFKFIWADRPDTSNITWESVDNRSYWVVDGPQEVSYFWDDVDPDANLADGNITFNVDMSVMTEVGIFDPDADSMQVRGGFNGWGDSDPTKAVMNQNILNADQWFLQVPFSQTPVGQQQDYKFYVKLADAATSMWTDGWERPFSTGGGNRPVDFEGTSDQSVDMAMYDDVIPNYVIEAGKNVSVGFQVDMTNAADGAIMPLPFDPATDTVYVVFEQPSFVFTQGWTDSDEMRVLQLTDNDGDMVYTGTLDVTAPAWNGFEYRYAYSSPANGFIAEPAGFGAFAYRVRYIEQAGYRNFVQPFTLGADTWINQEDKSAEWEAAPAGDIVGVEDGNELTPYVFDLKQNYPNPFNPSTLISFQIPENGMVTLRVYNVLGQKIATLINREMKAGNHEFNFNASNLATGVYVYSLKSGNFSATRKMMLLK